LASSATSEYEAVSIDPVKALLAESGYEVADSGDVLTIRDVESGIVIRGVLEENILFLAVTCLVVSVDQVTLELMRRMLAADNGISTSGFQLYEQDAGRMAITLNNFCKLQTMGPEDHDDILSCVEFLVIDVLAARRLIGDLVGLG